LLSVCVGPLPYIRVMLCGGQVYALVGVVHKPKEALRRAQAVPYPQLGQADSVEHGGDVGLCRQ
jgi:hypothetical protein